jgi:hypothetical protein
LALSKYIYFTHVPVLQLDDEAFASGSLPVDVSWPTRHKGCTLLSEIFSLTRYRHQFENRLLTGAANQHQYGANLKTLCG